MPVKAENQNHLDSWIEQVPLLQKGYHLRLLAKVEKLRRREVIYPHQGNILHALEILPFDAVRVVILGQDPYHGPGQAHGLAFSVPEGTAPPPSLNNIFKEVGEDIYGGRTPAFSPDLTRWARQGVLLLNTILSVEAGKAGSHRHLGWQRLTDQIIARLGEERPHLAFLLWGKPAASKKALLDPAHHLILEAPHPSPLSAFRGFFGCRHFSQANEFLRKHGLSPIVW